MISTTHIHISFQLQPEESPSTCDHSLSTCHQPSTITLHLPHFTIHLPPVTFHHSPSIKHHYSPPPPPATFYHTLSTMDLLHPAHLPSTIYQPPPSSMIHFYLLHSTMFLDCSQLTFLSLTFQHLLSSLPILPFHLFVITRFYLLIIPPGFVFLFKYSQVTIIQTT